MNALEIIAVVFAAVFLLKLLALLCCPKRFMKWGVGIVKNNMQTLKWLYVIIAVVVGFFVLTRVPIVIVMSVAIFTVALVKFSMICYEKESIAFVESLTRKSSKILAKAWLPVLVWLVLAVWTLWTVFR